MHCKRRRLLRRCKRQRQHQCRLVCMHACMRAHKSIAYDTHACICKAESFHCHFELRCCDCSTALKRWEDEVSVHVEMKRKRGERGGGATRKITPESWQVAATPGCRQYSPAANKQSSTINYTSSWLHKIFCSKIPWASYRNQTSTSN